MAAYDILYNYFSVAVEPNSKAALFSMSDSSDHRPGMGQNPLFKTLPKRQPQIPALCTMEGHEPDTITIFLLLFFS